MDRFHSNNRVFFKLAKTNYNHITGQHDYKNVVLLRWVHPFDNFAPGFVLHLCGGFFWSCWHTFLIFSGSICDPGCWLHSRCWCVLLLSWPFCPYLAIFGVVPVYWCFLPLFICLLLFWSAMLSMLMVE